MKILVIDDDEFFRKFCAAKLSENGHTVETAADGQEGLQKIPTFLPQAILLDMIMPKIDGFTVLQRLAGDPRYNKIPVIVFSTLGQEADVQKAKGLGARDFINKSFFDSGEVLAKITKLIQVT